MNEVIQLLSRRAIICVVVSLLLVVFTVLAMGGFFSHDLSPNYFYALVFADGVTMAFVGRMVWLKLFAGRDHSRVTAPLQKQITILCSLLSLIPATVVIVLAVVFFHYGVQDWFQGFVRTTIDESLCVAQSYLREHQSLVGRDARMMAQDIAANWERFPADEQGVELRQEYINAVCAMRSFSEMLIFDSSKAVVAKASMTFALEFEPVPSWAVDKANAGDVAVMTSESKERVRALLCVEVGSTNMYIFVGRPIDKSVLGHLERVDKAAAEYDIMKKRRVGLQIVSIILFLFGAGILLLIAVWVGMHYAEKLTRPIQFLIDYAENVASGKLRPNLESNAAGDELQSVYLSLKRMLKTIHRQQKEVLVAQHELEERNVFISNTLQGVSSGVLHLDARRRLRYSNNRATELLKSLNISLSIADDVSQHFSALAPLIDLADKSLKLLPSTELTVGRKILRVCVVSGGNEKAEKGYVITLEDITSLLSAQKKAAWADVARRIAHEVKNPLTPITLCVERLRKKYDDLDRGTVEKYVDTIQKQVQTIQHLIDDFASFARWPAPKKKTTDLVRVVRQSIIAVGSVFPGVVWQEHFDGLEEAHLWADPAQMGQLFHNIFKNACEAMCERDRQEKVVDISMGYIDDGGKIMVKIQEYWWGCRGPDFRQCFPAIYDHAH